MSPLFKITPRRVVNCRYVLTTLEKYDIGDTTNQSIGTVIGPQYSSYLSRVQKKTHISDTKSMFIIIFQRFWQRTVNKSFAYTNISYAKPLKLFTKSKISFRLQNVGVFTLNNLCLFNLKFKFKYRFKKAFFSFLFPNQLKKSLMDKKKRIIISRFFLRRRLKTLASVKFSFKTFKKKFKNFYSLKFLNTQGMSNSSNPLHFYRNTTLNILYKEDFLSKGIDSSSKIQEVFIRRVRFKPGYQRI
jgi:hypothetical protein